MKSAVRFLSLILILNCTLPVLAETSAKVICYTQTNSTTNPRNLQTVEFAITSAFAPSVILVKNTQTDRLQNWSDTATPADLQGGNPQFQRFNITGKRFGPLDNLYFLQIPRIIQIKKDLVFPGILETYFERGQYGNWIHNLSCHI